MICAFGRLGHWFAYEKFGIKPDLVTFAKGVTSGYIPLGGVMVGNRVAEVLIEQGGEFNHGYTYSGHPVACAVALANLELMERENLPGRVKDDVGPLPGRALRGTETPPAGGRRRDLRLCRRAGAGQEQGHARDVSTPTWPWAWSAAATALPTG